MEASVFSRIKKEIAETIKGAASSLGYSAENAESTVDFSKGKGDIASSVAFRIAKESKKDPATVANEINSRIKGLDSVQEITVENGFINFHLKREEFTRNVLEEQSSLKDLAEKAGNGRAIIEYVSVNPNKPWHVGHLRNALLGDSISNMYAALGHDVKRENYIDDLGLQMAETTWWFINRNNKPEKKFDHWLGEEYVKVNQELVKPEVKEGVEKVLGLMGQETYESKIARDIARGCVIAQNDTAESFSIRQDVLLWESDIVRAHLLEKALIILGNHYLTSVPKEGDYANCTIMDLKSVRDAPEELKGLKNDTKVLIRSNGTPTYIAKDIAFHMWKFGIIENSFRFSIFNENAAHPLYTTGPDGKSMDFADAGIAINIIDARQSYPQSIIRLVLNAIGRREMAENIRHLAYGEVELESGALSGRKGTWLGYSADDLLRESKAKAHTLISPKFKFGKEDEEKVVDGVAIAAIKFEFLKVAPEKKIVFSWGRALNFEGNSGPYAQYMHARASRIIDGSKDILKVMDINMPEVTDEEFALVKLLSKQYDVIQKAARELRPNVVTEYVTELASAFAKFYETSPILKAVFVEEKILRASITYTFKTTMANMLGLLGIEALERM